MEANYKVNEKLEFRVEAKGQKEMFKELAVLQEVFGEESCGMCKKKNIRYVVRTVDDNDYFELRCTDCGAVLSFGQHKKGGTVFPKRKDDAGSYMEHNGWHKWTPKKND